MFIDFIFCGYSLTDLSTCRQSNNRLLFTGIIILSRHLEGISLFVSFIFNFSGSFRIWSRRLSHKTYHNRIYITHYLFTNLFVFLPQITTSSASSRRYDSTINRIECSIIDVKSTSVCDEVNCINTLLNCHVNRFVSVATGNILFVVFEWVLCIFTYL
jgi:hypothetical protein